MFDARGIFGVSPLRLSYIAGLYKMVSEILNLQFFKCFCLGEKNTILCGMWRVGGGGVSWCYVQWKKISLRNHDMKKIVRGGGYLFHMSSSWVTTQFSSLPSSALNN